MYLFLFDENLPTGSKLQESLIFTVFIGWWPWKLGQGHQDLINSLLRNTDTIHIV